MAEDIPDTLVQIKVTDLFNVIRDELRTLSEHFSGLERRVSEQNRKVFEKVEEIDREVLALKLQAASEEAVRNSNKKFDKLSLGVIILNIAIILDIGLRYFHPIK